MITDRPYTML